ncbi:Uncharacterized protein dnm_076430 [Desulfonema magnum]|uniref:Uncharacterized protein n=1 Tax=Desulfonema magnum TaxID=45655 RepID=A0A975GSZ0_9BACT|nr:Uncharacterized protein dnm_076430 [Desulfonema magnum]
MTNPLCRIPLAGVCPCCHPTADPSRKYEPICCNKNTRPATVRQSLGIFKTKLFDILKYGILKRTGLNNRHYQQIGKFPASLLSDGQVRKYFGIISPKRAGI